MTDLYITILFVSIIIAFGIEILQSKTFHKSCLTGDKNLFLLIGMTFLGIHLFITFPGMISIKIWMMLNLIVLWILSYYRETIKKEILFKNISKLLKSQRRKIFFISSILCYIIVCLLLNYYIVYKFIYSSAVSKLTITFTISFLILTEAKNIACFITILKFYCISLVTIWGENLVKYEGWLIGATRDYYILKEKFSGKLITVKKDIVNQIVIMGKVFER
ncbi:hypothetical protein B0S90_0356 [Caldicellulosiruptor bescii]|uniref:Uncharacterized protein n=3 Tax=Caldicellulosiruptor bescii TaxID=31899 RepID=B9MLP0_CALBD|nr:hypothetical protein [Caldicellulosiruptor bescii]ACM59248.1 hypothetical protein Athe_0088 [Caldicellulosiruptor bescii DSM 6725]PBC88294.1 hypothetical protein B0S87_1269 [Caldicellulosiruptor bescii]PBC92225.1 hypothetical protein B0S89_2724 [Caldicellulosiruptor bescii]PBD04966.1 hypothetical protein B0S85_2683 [Caldicellulosiruptor bescii]PBD05404.1 hypothetical protein B0S90_0356 [Caldicellulosiruptor bescii]